MFTNKEIKEMDKRMLEELSNLDNNLKNKVIEVMAWDLASGTQNARGMTPENVQKGYISSAKRILEQNILPKGRD